MISVRPQWLRVRVRSNQNPDQVFEMLKSLGLNTVCEEAECPNLMDCFARKTATFIALGKVCTRNCAFCAVEKGVPHDPDPVEPVRIARAVQKMQLKHAVITMVTRDDLEDNGAGHMARIINEIRKINEKTTVEVLISDMQGSEKSLQVISCEKPDIIGHNIETVPRLYKNVRSMANYYRSLEILAKIKDIDNGIFTKSGIMVGLGESKKEVIESMKDLRKAGCDFLTVGQYLAPSEKHHPVVEYIHPDVFEEYKETGLELGFKFVASAPLVRSSYMAEEALKNNSN